MVAMQHKSSELSGGPPAFSTVAVAVNGYVGEANGGAGSRRAVRWAVENLLPTADRFVLVHVMPTVTSIPSPSGVRIPVDGLDESVVAMYKRDLIKEFEQVFLPFKRICKSTQMETLLLEHNDPSKALLKHISDSGFQCLVMGSSSSNFLARKKGKGIPLTILGEAPEKCEIYVVYKDRIKTKSAVHSPYSVFCHFSPYFFCDFHSQNRRRIFSYYIHSLPHPAICFRRFQDQEEEPISPRPQPAQKGMTSSLLDVRSSTTININFLFSHFFASQSIFLSSPPDDVLPSPY